MFLKKIKLLLLLISLGTLPTFALNNDLDANNVSDIVWKNGSYYSVWYMNENGTHKYHYLGKVLESKYIFLQSADFNGDATSDIIWKNGSYYSVWYMNKDGSHNYHSLGKVLDSKYTLVASADFNGDGISDIIWKNGSYYSLWYMNQDGSHNYHSLGKVSESKYTLVASADFNGDGISDIVWKNGSYYSIWYMNDDGTHSYHYLGKVLESKYKLVQSADLNGDGIFDIIWKNGSYYSIWYMNKDGSHKYHSLGKVLESKYTLVASADFNGDGVSDIVWKNGSYYSLWYMNEDGTHSYHYLGKVLESKYSLVQNKNLLNSFTLYEDAENNLSTGWRQVSGSYKPLRVPNGFNSKGALVLAPEWIDNYSNIAEYQLDMNNSSQKILEMDMGGLKDYRLPNLPDAGYIQHYKVGVRVNTSDGKRAMLWDSFFNHGGVEPFKDGKWLSYPSPVEHVRGYEEVGGLPIDQWVHFRVDVEKELQKLEPNNKLLSIDTFFATGGFLDNLKLSTY